MSKRKPIIYGTYTSPTVNAVLLTLKALQADYEFREIKPRTKENLTEEYLRKNPAHTVPTLETEDNQFIGDSHAINMYLVDKYGKADDPLYPKDLYRRAKINELLHFDNGILFMSCVKAAYWPVFQKKSTSIPEEFAAKFDEAYDMLERYIGDNKYVAGPELTIADFSCIVSIYSMCFFRPVTAETHPRVSGWLARMQELKYLEETIMTGGMGLSMNFMSKQLSHL